MTAGVCSYSGSTGLRAIVYGWSTCAHCERAKRLLARHGVAFREELLDGRRELFARIQAQYGRATAPIVLLDGELVGGIEELETIERAGGFAVPALGSPPATSSPPAAPELAQATSGARAPLEVAEPRSPAPVAPTTVRAAEARTPRWLALLALALLVLATRVPFLRPGFGLDSDAWQMAAASRELSVLGRYAYSRPPGYPVPEIVGALFWRGGAFALNGLSALACAASAVFLALLVRRTNPRAAIPAAIGFAFTPIVFVASTSALDFLWAQAFALAGLWLALRGRSVACGLALGLAIASRLPTGVMLAPCALLLLRGRGGLRRAALACALALATAVPWYVPAIQRYGLHGLAPFAGWSSSVGQILERSTVLVYGPVGTLAVALAVFIALRSVARRGREDEGVPERRELSRALLAGMALVYAVFLWKPFEAQYLVPFVALLLPLLALHLAPRAAWWLATALVLSAFFGGKRALLAPGAILRDHAERVREEDELLRIRRTARAMQPAPVVIAGPWLSKFTLLAGGVRDGRVEYRFTLTAEEARSLRAAGRPILFVDGIEDWHRHFEPASFAELGAHPVLGGNAASKN